MGANELKGIFPEKKKAFDFPKSTPFLDEFISFVVKENDLLLDSFAGSGTTAHAVLKLNEQDGGNRRFILIETMEYAETITAERVRRVMTGYGSDAKAVAGLGGGFDYYEMGDALFQPDGNLNEAVGVEEIRRYVAYTEGVQPTERAAPPPKTNGKFSRYLLGMAGETAVVFYYEPDQATKLDAKFLASLKLKPASAIIYADLCLLDTKFLKRHNIIFKKIPREIRKF
ncbi:MAG: DNA methyltransferase [Blastocatellia bacterium]